MDIRSNPLLAIVGNPGPPAGRDETVLCEQCGALIYKGTRGHGFVKGRCPLHGGSWQKILAERDYPLYQHGVGGGRRSRGQASKMNPAEEVHPLAFEARDRYRDDMRAGHDEAAEYWRGQAGAFFTGNNPLGPVVYYPVFDDRTREYLGAVYSDDALDAWRAAEEEFGSASISGPVSNFTTRVGLAYHSLKSLIAREGMPPVGPIPGKRIGYYGKGGPLYGQNPGWESELDIAEAQLALAERRAKKNVAGSKSRGNVKSKGRKVRGNPQEQKKRRPKVTRYSLEEARKKFRGLDAAIKKFKRFHGAGSNPDHVDVYHLPDGRSEERVENVHAALHRTLETPYVVPWKSNKKGTLWLHEHPEGDGAPLEVLDPETGTTRKIAGDYVVDDWWES